MRNLEVTRSSTQLERTRRRDLVHQTWLQYSVAAIAICVWSLCTSFIKDRATRILIGILGFVVFVLVCLHIEAHACDHAIVLANLDRRDTLPAGVTDVSSRLHRGGP